MRARPPTTTNRFGGINFQPDKPIEQQKPPTSGLVKVPMSQLLHHSANKDQLVEHLGVKGVSHAQNLTLVSFSKSGYRPRGK